MARKKPRSKAQKAATKRMLAGLRRSRRGQKPLARSAKKSSPKRRSKKKTGGQVSRFFGLGKDIFARARRAPMVQRAITEPMQHAAAGVGYAGFEAVTLPLAARLKNGLILGWKIPIPATQVFGAWLLAQTPWRVTKAVGLEGIGIESYTLAAQTQLARTIQTRAAMMLNRVLPAAEVTA